MTKKIKQLILIQLRKGLIQIAFNQGLQTASKSNAHSQDFSLE